jgi:hypothetical protein
MCRFAAASLGLLLLICPLRGQEPQGRLVEDAWHAALLNGAQAGYVHTTVREIERGGNKLLRVTSELKLTFQREGRRVVLRVETGDEETREGKVTGVFMRQYQGQQLLLNLEGTVQDGTLAVQVNGVAQMNKKIPWHDEVIGAYRQEHLFRDRKVKPGDHVTFVSFEPTVDTVITNRVTVKDFENVTMPGGKKQRLLRVEEVPDKLQTTSGEVQLPPMTTWLDQDLVPLKSKSEQPLLGTLEICRTTRQNAQAQAQAGPELLQPLLLNRAIAQPNATRSAMYRITIKGDDDPASTFVQDGRQQVEKIDTASFKLRVQAGGASRKSGNAPVAGKEFLESCFWIKSDDPQVREHAQQAIGAETDSWRQARLIERWVHNHMTVSFTEQFCPADQVARNLRGDCRQHAFLTAAMCRAVGLPSRTAIGLCYANDPRKGPIMAFHMWTEVYIEGKWIPIDATRGEGHVGATHLKITDSSWAGTQSLAPLLPVLRVLDKMSIEVLGVSYAN